MDIIRKEFPVLLFSMAIFFCFSSTSASPLFSPSGVGYEVIALVGIKLQLIDPNGVLDNWDESSRDPCSWTLVTCSPDGLVVSLEAPSQGLSGTLAATIGNLTNIQFVLLQNNNISGGLPSEIGRLSKLQTLDLSNNTFSGQIPSTFSHLKSLQHLMVAKNNLSGEIPAPLANLTHLNLIDLSFNNLSGHVPEFPDKVFNIKGNPYICNNGAEKVGCSDKQTGLLFSSCKAKLNFPSGINKSGIFVYWILILLMMYSLPLTHYY